MMVIWLESFRIAFREMRRHGTRSVLTMLGVIIGVAAIIAVVSISEGAKRKIQGQIANLGTNMIMVLPGSITRGGARAGTASAYTLTMQDAEAIQQECSAVAHAVPATRDPMQVESSLANWSTRVYGTTPDYLAVRAWKTDGGRNIEPRDVDAAAKVAVLGRTVRKELFGQMDPIGERIRIHGIPFEVIGTLEEKGQSPLGEDQDDAVLVPITAAFIHLKGGDRPGAICVSAVSDADTPLAVKQIQTLLHQRHRIGPNDVDDFTVRSIAEAAKTAEETSDVMTVLLVSIAAISLLVGGIGIMNIMLVTVMERTREIGIRMALGATRRMILRQFMIEAGTLAGVGGFAGVVLGVFGSSAISRLTGWPAILTPTLLVGPLAFAVVIGMLFGLLPARRASSLSPVESLRHE